MEHQPPLEITPTDDGLGYHVSLTLDGITARVFVSSMHLADEKRGQLLRAVARSANEAFEIHPPQTDDSTEPQQ